MNVEARAVQRRYRNGRGVGPVSLRVEAGECVALMGPNGAGKTTLLRLLATAATPQRGHVTWNGRASSRAARRDIGFAADVVAEEGALTARQATHFWCGQWVRSAAVPQLVSAALDAVSLLDVADEPVSAFSFGMRRRLAIAQALAHRPRIALLDEPTAGLDPDGAQALQRLLDARAADGDITLVASNDCSFVAAACSRVVFLDAGELVRDARPAELLAEVGGARRARLDVSESFDATALQRIPGVGDVVRDDGAVEVELLHHGALAAVVAAADDGNGRLRGLRLHSPDLSDSFRMLTGRSLAAERRPASGGGR
ncbi:MAG: ABC transporter ATP-binding protein [Candidatus Dormibacteraeota bacterium]|nr:ABC transporter ATP-binding protein [Candidatus Dormibacteraeota bacterium]MBV9525839.1 ABC transporter ATP-binding protein [Candidatus Dormibacteraeota bacterium]